jgi:hypothetical protein
MANEFIARKGIISLDDAQITGSLSVTGNISASIFTGSFVGDGSQLSGIEGFPFTGSAEVTGSLTVVGPVNATTFTGDGSQLTGIEGFPFTGSAGITGSLTVVGPVNATSFTGSLQGTATSASYVQLANIDGFTAYSASVNTAIDSVLDATTPLTATVNTTNTPFTLTSQSIVVADSTDGNLTINLPDLNAIVGTPNQKPIIVYKNDYSQNVIYVQPSGSQLVNGASQDIIVSIQLAVIYNPTSAGWVTEGTSAQSLAELELFFLPLTETGSLATTGSNTFIGNQTVTGSLTVTGGINATITGSATSASYVEYVNVANKPTLVSGSSQVTYSDLTGVPTGIVSSSTQITGYNIFATTGSNQFNGSQVVTGSLTVTGQVVAQTLNVQQVTSSIVYSSGSNVFGNSLSNTQQFTGSVSVTGSMAVAGALSSGTLTINGADNRINSGNELRFYRTDNAIYTRLYDGGNANGFVLDNRNGEGFSFQAAGTNQMRITSTGNLSLGVTPSAWGTDFKAIQIGTSGGTSFVSDDWNGFTEILNNVFASSRNTYTRIQSLGAARYSQQFGTHVWYSVGAGSGGTTVSFTPTMTLNASGNLSIGNTNDTYKLDVSYSTSAGNRRFLVTSTGPKIIRSGDNDGWGLGYGFLRNDGTDLGTGFGGLGNSSGLVYYFIGNSFDNNNAVFLPNGNVGIGTNNPGQKLEVVGGEIKAGRVDSSNEGGQVSFGRASDNATGWYIDAFGSTSTPALRFVDVSNSEVRMTITSGGEVLVGMTSNTGASITSVRAGLFSGQRDNSIDPVFQAWNQGTSLDNQFVHFYTEGGSGTYRGSIDFNRGAGLVRYNTSSDYRLKSEIEDFNASEIILNLKPKKYRIGDAKQKTIGFIAHELQEYYPQAVSGAKDQVNQNGDPIYQGVDYSQLTGLLVKAIQEQQSQIESLKAEIQTLKQ